MAIRIKICGITRVEDAWAAVEAGADALGFMIYGPSKRFIRANDVPAVVRDLPPFVSRVGVFVNESTETILACRERCQFDTIQLHGEESPEFCQTIPGPVIKAFRLQSRSGLEALSRYPASAWLLDSYSPAARGGTGECFNWNWIREAGSLGCPIIVAGGLTPDNVARCIETTRPFGIDVSSGVEASPGRKDASRMTDFILAAREAANALNPTISSRSRGSGER